MRVIVSSLCVKKVFNDQVKNIHIAQAYLSCMWSELTFFKVKELLNLAGCKTFKPVHFNEVKRESESDYEPHVHQRSQIKLLFAAISDIILWPQESFWLSSISLTSSSS